MRLLTERDEQLAALSKKYKRIFSGKWSRYAWGNFVTLTGDQLFDSIRSAIENLQELPDLSETGRLLFRRATLKIYDRPTLRAVIQSIHEMDLTEHDGADIKGDMYEYLLSKISMSGTNGQFRTPRHIIDFIVEVVDPKPDRRICDPACGTAGFLISSFNHILKQNTSKADLKTGNVTGDKLKPAQWKFLEQQAFTGFDNDANMIKIAILNLYLHKLEKANIDLHNPLTTTRGGTYPGPQYDCILANPPFSGKVQKESILSDLNHGLNTRATELLFLKWFIDHLADGGRAGVIVPDGIVATVNKAYNQLRKMLLENFLYAVVSLPAGVFNPYSGVKTSILLMDKTLAKKTDEILFIQVENTGYDLGATRRPIKGNQLPLASELLKKYKNVVTEHSRLNATIENSSIAHLVKKTTIAESGDYTLIGERYKHELIYRNIKFKVVELGDMLVQKNERQKHSEFEVWSVSNQQGFVPSRDYFNKKIPSENTDNYKIIKPNYFAYNPSRINVGSIAVNKSSKTGIVSPMYVVFAISDAKKLDRDFLYLNLKSDFGIKQIIAKSHGAVRKILRFNDLKTIKIPLPSLDVQKAIIAETDK
ncbi:hypothetical protein ES703_91435 [subsurface metagenome]